MTSLGVSESPDLGAGFTRQTMTAEELTELGHPLTLLPRHLPDPGGEGGVGADVTRALASCHHTGPKIHNVHLNVGALGGEPPQHPVLPHQLRYQLLVTQAILKGDEHRALRQNNEYEILPVSCIPV